MTSPFNTGRRGVQYGGGLGGAASVTGAEDFLALSRRLKAAGRGDLRRELNKAMSGAAKPLIPKVKQAAQQNLPQRGGLATRIARKSYRAQTRTGATTAGVRIVGSKVDPRIDQQGRVAHPVFGRPGSMVVQQVPAAKGYFSETLSQEGPQVRDELVKTLEQWADRLVRGGI